MKKKYKFFYLFWIKSSRGTDDICIRAYEDRPTKDQLQDDVEHWIQSYGAVHVSENRVLYGYKVYRKIPRDRRSLHARYKRARKKFQEAQREAKIAAQLLGLM